MQALLPWILVGLFVLTMWGNREPAPVAEDMTKVPMTPTFQWNAQNDKGQEKADAFARFTHLESGHSLGVAVFDGGRELRISNDDADRWQYQGQRYSYFWNEYLDVGAFAAARPDAGEGYDLGIRLSPVRVLYGTISPDALVGAYSVGLGASAYLPPGLVPRKWDRLGLGLGYLIDYRDNEDGRREHGYAAYLALSTRY